MFIYQSPTNNYFNKTWYKNTYNLDNIKDDELLNYYCTVGYKLNHNPSLYLNTKWYINTYNVPENIDPLTHFISGIQNTTRTPNEHCKYFIDHQFNEPWTSITGDFIPLRNEKKRINLLLPGPGLSAGPQTLYIFANLLYNNGYNVRVIFTYDNIPNNFIKEIQKRLEFSDNIELESQYKNDIKISYNDLFIISAWWTAYPLKFILGYLNYKKFFWFIQENELIFHQGDDVYNRALECYNMDYHSFVHGSLLFDCLKEISFGHFKNKEYISQNTICFEPAINNKLFYYEKKNITRKYKVIFYSRNAAPRNLQNTIIDLLKNSYKNGILNINDFELIGFGESKGRKLLCNNIWYEDLGFLDFDNYSKLMREADIVINFVLSPHSGLIPLEMAFCNGLCIHNNYLYKNKDSMSRYSDKIIMCDANLISLMNGLEKAVQIIRQNNISTNIPKLIHHDWNIALFNCLNFLKKEIIMVN